MTPTPTIEKIYYEIRRSPLSNVPVDRPREMLPHAYPTNPTPLRYSRVGNPVHVVTLTASIEKSSNKSSMSSTRRAEGAASGTCYTDMSEESSQNGGTGGSSVLRPMTAATSAADVNGTSGTDEREQNDCLNDVIINSVDLCGLADAQFVDRMKFDRKFRHAVTRRNNVDYRTVSAKAKSGSTIQADKRRDSSFSFPQAASRSNTGPIQKYDRSDNSGRERTSRPLDDSDVRNFNRSNTCDDVATSDDKLPAADMQLDLPLSSEVDGTTVDAEFGRLTSEEVTSLSSSSPRRAMLSFYNLRVWPEKEGPVGGSRRIPVYRADGGEHRTNGNVGGGQRRNGDQQTSSPEEPIRHQWTQLPQQAANRGDGKRTSVERIRTLRRSYPDDPILRRILGIGMQANTQQDLPRTAQHPTFVNPVLRLRARTGSRRPGTESSSRSAVPSRGGGSLRKPEGPPSIGSTDSRGLFPDASAMSKTTMTGEHLAIGQRDQRSQRGPSVTLMFERSVTRIEPGWKTDPSLAHADETTGTGNDTSGLVAVVVEDDDVTHDAGVKRKSQKQPLSNEVNRQRINWSAAALLSIATTGSTPRPPCNSPDQQPDDYFWSDTVFRPADSQPATLDKITAPLTILSHSDSRQSAAERFQRNRMLSSSRSASGISASMHRPRRAYTSGFGANADVKLQTPRANPAFGTLLDRRVTTTEDFIGNNDGEQERTEQTFVDLKPQPSRIVVYVPH